MKKKIPNGEANFERLRSQGCYYVDRTSFIQKLEDVSNKNIFFLRPRKFGKSLFISMLCCYYGVEYKERFTQLFGDLDIAKTECSLANRYYVLLFDFSGLDSKDPSEIENFFNSRVIQTILSFNKRYSLLGEKEENIISSSKSAAEALTNLLQRLQAHGIFNKLYIIVDEYDHFTNELFSFNRELFQKTVAQNGFVRKFYETIKSGSRDGVVERFFATGVTPFTLDSMTSGFNIVTNLTLHPHFNELLGFTEKEVEEMLSYYEVQDKSAILADMQNLYNGSMFHPQAFTRLYNSTMVVYFMESLNTLGVYPNPIIDYNIISDYSKINAIFALISEEETNNRIEELMISNETTADITHQFTYERRLTSDDIVSLLFYHGLLTIKREALGSTVFRIPNYAISEMYWKYQANRMQELNAFSIENRTIRDALSEMAQEGSMKSWMALINNTLDLLSNRDLQNFNEKYIKMLFLSFLSLSPLYYKKSESEVQRNYPDLLLLENPFAATKFQYLFEFKYIKILDNKSTDQVVHQGIEQINRYKAIPEISNLKALKCFLIVTTGAKAVAIEV